MADAPPKKNQEAERPEPAAANAAAAAGRLSREANHTARHGLHEAPESTRNFVSKTANQTAPDGRKSFDIWASSGHEGKDSELSQHEIANLLNRKHSGDSKAALKIIDNHFSEIATTNATGEKVVTEESLRNWASKNSKENRNPSVKENLADRTEKLKEARRIVGSNDVDLTVVDYDTKIKLNALGAEAGGGYGARAKYGNTERGYIFDKNKQLTAFEEKNPDGSKRFVQKDEKDGHWYERPNGPNDTTGQTKISGKFDLDQEHGTFYHLRSGTFDPKTHIPKAGSVYSAHLARNVTEPNRNNPKKMEATGEIREFRQEVASDGTSWALASKFKKEEKTDGSDQKLTRSVIGQGNEADEIWSYTKKDGWRHLDRDDDGKYSGKEAIMVGGKPIKSLTNPEIAENGTLNYVGDNQKKFSHSVGAVQLDLDPNISPILDEYGKYAGFNRTDGKSSVRFAFRNGITSGQPDQVISETRGAQNNMVLRTIYEPKLDEYGNHERDRQTNMPMWNTFVQQNQEPRRQVQATAHLFNVDRQGHLTDASYSPYSGSHVYDWHIGQVRQATESEQQYHHAYLAYLQKSRQRTQTA